MRRISVLLMFGFIALLSACGGVEPHPPIHITIAGSTSMQPLLQELAEAYTQRHEYVTIDVQAGGSRLGVKAVQEGTADIGMASRELSEEEGTNLQAIAIAEDGIAILVNAQNEVDSLSLADIERIFAGRILDWSEVGGKLSPIKGIPLKGDNLPGGKSGEILVVSREEGSGTREAFEGMVMRGKRVTPTAVVMPSSEAVREFVADNPQAISYVSMGFISPGVKAVRVNGVESSPETVRQGQYPLVRPFLLLIRPEPNQEVTSSLASMRELPISSSRDLSALSDSWMNLRACERACQVRAFIEFILSPAGQAIVGRRHGRVG